MKVVTAEKLDLNAWLGVSARKLYKKFGFKDQEPMGENPAGTPVALMVRPIDPNA